MQKSNVFLITIECLRADHIALFGYEKNTTPFLNELFRHCTVFSRAYAAGPFTTASFPSIFSSTCPHMLGYGHLHKRLSFVEFLRQEGYITLGFSFTPVLSCSRAFHKGFLIYVDSPPDYRHKNRFLRRLLNVGINLIPKDALIKPWCAALYNICLLYTSPSPRD